MRPQREWKAEVRETACEKFERRLSEELGDVRLEMANLRVDTTQQMSRMHTSLLPWMFVFWIGQLMTAIGIVATVLRVAKLL